MSKWIPNGFTKEEELGLTDIEQFCALPPMRDYFERTGGTEYGTICDALGENRTGGTNIIEAKHRAAKSKEYDDIFIEVEKYNHLMRLYDKGMLPFYLNRFDGDDNFYVWILPSIPIKECRLYKNKKIRDLTTGGFKYEDRYGLKWEQAWVFSPDGEVIQRSSVEHNIPQPPRPHDIDLNKPINNKILNLI